MPNVKLVCKTCSKEFEVPHWRKEKAKYCSIPCQRQSLRAKPNSTCDHCGKEFHMKESRKKKHFRTLGLFCSIECVNAAKVIKYRGENNPNYKGITQTQDGYYLAAPSNGYLKEHQRVTFETLGINMIPKGHQIHHRDCIKTNNSPSNLALLTNSDHRWLHKNFGNYPLKNYVNKKVSLEIMLLSVPEELKIKATDLLNANLLMQREVFKFGELLGSPNNL